MLLFKFCFLCNVERMQDISSVIFRFLHYVFGMTKLLLVVWLCAVSEFLLKSTYLIYQCKKRQKKQNVQILPSLMVYTFKNSFCLYSRRNIKNSIMLFAVVSNTAYQSLPMYCSVPRNSDAATLRKLMISPMR